MAEKMEKMDNLVSEWQEHQKPIEDKALQEAAVSGNLKEHDLTVRQALTWYPTAIAWCLVISTCVIMEGYDMALLGNLYAYPTFQRKFGRWVGISDTTRSGYQLEAKWQAALSNGAGIGAFFGTLINGYLNNLFGARRVVLGALFLLSAAIFITFFAPTQEVLLVGQIISGLPWGVFATTAPSYASEILPLPLRVYFTSFTNMCFIIGQLIATGVLSGLQSRDDEWGFRIPFALQWMWPCFLVPLIWFAPDSPWHEVRHQRYESAERAIRRVQRASAPIDPKDTLATIVYTNNLEEELSVGTSYWDCFSGFELRRTEIACMCFAGQVLSGSSFAYLSSYFFEQLGLETHKIYSLNVGGTGLALVGTVFNWIFLMPYFGRRTIYLGGLSIMCLTLFIIGVLNVWTSNGAVSWVQAILTLVWTFTFQLSVGQLGWALPAEIGSTRLRTKTICIARNAYYIISVISQVLQPYFMNPSELNLRGYTGFVWGSTAFLTLLWAFFRLPETRSRSNEELDVLFAQKISARKFAKTDVNAFDTQVTDDLAKRYSVSSLNDRRPSLVPSVTERIASIGGRSRGDK